jgi:hypothetical protein
MKMPEIREVKPFVDTKATEEGQDRADAVRSLGAQYSSKGCSCSTFLGATT